MIKKKEPVKATATKAPVNEPKVIKPKVKEMYIGNMLEKNLMSPFAEKHNIYGGVPTVASDHVRVIVLKDHNTMSGELLRVDDILDIPERRYKSLSFRGMVKIYEGKNQPNKMR